MCARMCTRDAHDAFAREPSESDSSGDRQPVAYCGKTALTLWPYALCFNGECRQETQARYSLHRSRCFLLPAKKARLAAISTQQPEAPASLTQTSETLRKLCHTRCRSVAVSNLHALFLALNRTLLTGPSVATDLWPSAPSANKRPSALALFRAAAARHRDQRPSAQDKTPTLTKPCVRFHCLRQKTTIT